MAGETGEPESVKAKHRKMLNCGFAEDSSKDGIRFEKYICLIFQQGFFKIYKTCYEYNLGYKRG